MISVLGPNVVTNFALTVAFSVRHNFILLFYFDNRRWTCRTSGMHCIWSTYHFWHWGKLAVKPFQLTVVTIHQVARIWTWGWFLQHFPSIIQLTHKQALWRTSENYLFCKSICGRCHLDVRRIICWLICQPLHCPEQTASVCVTSALTTFQHWSLPQSLQ